MSLSDTSLDRQPSSMSSVHQYYLPRPSKYSPFQHQHADNNNYQPNNNYYYRTHNNHYTNNRCRGTCTRSANDVIAGGSRIAERAIPASVGAHSLKIRARKNSSSSSTGLHNLAIAAVAVTNNNRFSAASDAPPIIFAPPDINWQREKAHELGLTIQRGHWLRSSHRKRTFTVDSPPKQCEQVSGDGNCLFRSLSFWITGSEDYHLEIREMIVQEIHDNSKLYSAVTSNHSMTNYLHESNMTQEGVWGSEVEIFVAATLLRTSIAVYAAFGDKFLWQVFKPLERNRSSSHGRSNLAMLYLQNSNNHFEPVIDI